MKDPLVQGHWRPEQWSIPGVPLWGLSRPEWQHIKTGPQSGKGRRVVFDIEGNGLLRQQGSKQAGDKLWCVGAKDLDTGERFYWGWDQGGHWIGHALDFLIQVDLALAHNGTSYDYPYLEEHALEWGWDTWTRPAKAWDTIVAAKLVWPAEVLKNLDFPRIRAGQLPAHMLARHSLEAWGYRTGTHKEDYRGGFEEWCPAMASYLMTGDLDGPEALWRLVEKRVGWSKDSPPGALVWDETTFVDEMAAARIVFEQQEDGVRFDERKARALAKELQNEQKRLERELVATFGSWWEPLDDPETGHTPTVSRSVKLVGEPDITIPRFGKSGRALRPYIGPPFEHYTAGQPYVRIERTTFNPGSRDHLGQRLQAVYGWKPKKFGKDGKPSVDETTLEEIPDAVLPANVRQMILDYFVVTKTYGMLVQGRQSWLGAMKEDGRIHGKVDPLGTITRRAAHSGPNLGQCPAVKKEKVKQPDGSVVEEVLRGLPGKYGYECRELFGADEGWEQTGVDASSLELIDLGHYLWKFDDGAFSARVCDPTRDAHREHAEICGTTRADAKTTIYLKVYGGSAFKLSLDPAIIVTPEEVPALLSYRGLPGLLRSLAKRFDDDFVAKMDDMQRARLAKCRIIILKLEEGIAGLKELQDDVTKAGERGWLKAMDGSRLPVRKAYAALNSLLQHAGAASCKRWMRLVHEELRARGLQRGRDFKQVLWVHDELQFTHRPGLGPLIREVAEACMVKTGESLGLRGRYRTEGKTGRNWAECH